MMPRTAHDTTTRQVVLANGIHMKVAYDTPGIRVSCQDRLGLY